MDPLPQLGQLPHPLEQLQALLQGAGGLFVMALLAVVRGGGQGCLSRQQGEVGFASAPQGRGLGGMEGAGGQGEGIKGLTCLQEQQQTGHLPAGGDLQGRDQLFLGRGQGGEVRFVGGPPFAVAEQIGAGPQQISPGLQGVHGVALVRRPIQPQLQGAKHGLGIGRRAHAEQPEMVKRQVQPFLVP